MLLQNNPHPPATCLVPLDVLEKAIQGNPAAQKRLEATYRKALHRYCYHFFNNPDEADDVTQETLAAAFQSLDRLKDLSRFHSWIFTIALRKCRHRLTSLLAERKHISLDGAPDDDAAALLLTLPDSAPRPDQEALNNAMLDEILCHLPRGEKAVVTKLAEGKDTAQIANELAMTEGAVRQSKFSAAKRIKKFWGELLS